MSHFTVLVIGDDIEKQLAPFQENNMGDCPSEYMVFTDVEAEYREEYENEGTKMLRAPDGELYYSWDRRFEVGNDLFNKQKAVPSDYVEVEVPHKERYPSFESFIKDWAGYSKDPATGRYGYWENPNRKWDWYQIGGRWTGMFKLLPEAGGEVGSPGLMTNPAEVGFADQARKRDIDFEGMRDKREAEVRGEFQKYRELTAGLVAPEPWDKFRENFDSIEEARKAWHELVWVSAVNQGFHFWDTDTVTYFADEEATVKKEREKAIATFAVLKDGQWYERGEMGWWAFVSDDKGEEWYEQYAQLLDELPDDTLLTVVDCHI
jgi:hypothetical protein